MWAGRDDGPCVPSGWHTSTPPSQRCRHTVRLYARPRSRGARGVTALLLRLRGYQTTIGLPRFSYYYVLFQLPVSAYAGPRSGRREKAGGAETSCCCCCKQKGAAVRHKKTGGAAPPLSPGHLLQAI